MYPLSMETDLSFLIGRELLQVCVGRNEIILNFDEDVRITIFEEFALGAPRALRRHEESTVGGAAVFELLHDTIVAAVPTPAGDLAIDFRSGLRLEAYNSQGQFECFTIENGSTRIIV